MTPPGPAAPRRSGMVRGLQALANSEFRNNSASKFRGPEKAIVRSRKRELAAAPHRVRGGHRSKGPCRSWARFKDHVEWRLGCAVEALETGFGRDLAQSALAGLGAEP